MKFDTILKPVFEPILPLRYLKTKYGRMHWESQVSGIKIPEDVADKIEAEFRIIKKFSMY